MFYGQQDGSSLDHAAVPGEIAHGIPAEFSGSAPDFALRPLAGDFYRDPDDVTRGLTIDPAEASHFSDFCREPDDIVKGLWTSKESKVKSSAFASTDYLKDVMMNKNFFEKTDKPPPLPNDDFFELELTTLHATGEPDVIGNHVLDFLCNQTVSSITKVRRNKFSIKAAVFVDNLMCTVKVRLYDCDSGRFAIEFQKRSGNEFVYNTVYQKACQYLKSLREKGMQVTGGPEAPMTVATGLALPELPTQEVVNEVDFAPILDLAGMVHSPTLQAEAATALATMAEDHAKLSHLSTMAIFDAIQKLWQAQEVEVAYPTSRLLGHLAEKEEAIRFFDTVLLAQIIEKVNRDPAMLVQQELAKVLNVALQRKVIAGQPLQESEAATLKSLLTTALQEKGTGNSMMLENLEGAQRSLCSFMS